MIRIDRETIGADTARVAVMLLLLLVGVMAINAQAL
jgi:hypothetical protein